MEIRCASSSQGRGWTSQDTKAFAAIHSDSACSSSTNVIREPEPTRRSSSPSASVRRLPSVFRRVDFGGFADLASGRSSAAASG